MLLEQLCLGADIAKGEVFFWEQIAVGAVLSGSRLFLERFYLGADIALGAVVSGSRYC